MKAGEPDPLIAMVPDWLYNGMKNKWYIDEIYAKVRDTVADGGTLLFVGTKRQAQETIAFEAGRCGMPYVTERWLGGMLTNYQTIKRSIERLKRLEQMESDGSIHRFPKKEVLSLQREMSKLERNLGGIKDMNGLPGFMFVIDPKRERIAVREARRVNVPVVASGGAGTVAHMAEALTALAAELAPKIRVNAIAPSLTAPPLAASLLNTEEKQKAADDRHPLKRIGHPPEIAAAALFLLGGASWVTGQIIHVDGGMGSLRTFK